MSEGRMPGPRWIIDTNVLLIANGAHDDVGPDCVAACALTLQEILQSGRVVIDDGWAILEEYGHKLRPNRGKGPGDVFLKWLLRQTGNPARCEQVAITPDEARGWAEFPDDPALGNFDPPDRKFVAVASAHPAHPPILQAADSKWLDWAPDLAHHGVEVRFICKDEAQRFHHNKFGR